METATGCRNNTRRLVKTDFDPSAIAWLGELESCHPLPLQTNLRPLTTRRIADRNSEGRWVACSQCPVPAAGIRSFRAILPVPRVP